MSRCRTVKSNDTLINEEQTDFAKQNKNHINFVVGVTFQTLCFAEL